MLSLKGIAEGVENSNFLLHTAKGYFILTLYEKRVDAGDLPFFLGLMEHLAARGLTCPLPVRNRDGDALGRLAGRPAAIVTFLDGMWVRRPQRRAIARAVGTALAGCISPARTFAMTRRNALSVDGLAAAVRELRRRAPTTWPRASRETIATRARPCSSATGRSDLPHGVIHADLFPDNVFFLGDGCPA